MSERPRVWITRAEPGATATASRLEAIGFAPLIAPLLSVRPLEATIDLTGVTALAFTSTNALQVFVQRELRRDLPVFTVGDATAKAARRAGFTLVESADGEMRDLCRLILEKRPEGEVLHPTGTARAGDLVGYLRKQGVQARQIELYDTPAVERLPDSLIDALQAREVTAILIHSPRAGAVLAELIAEFDLSEVVALGFSSHCLRPLKALEFGQVIQAKRPREDALLNALLATLGNSPSER